MKALDVAVVISTYRTPVQPVIVDVVEAEVVEAGLARGHPDAAAIEAAIAALSRRPTPSGPGSADAAVLEATRGEGTLVANDLALGRRARTLGCESTARRPGVEPLVVRARSHLAAARRSAALRAGRGLATWMLDQVRVYTLLLGQVVVGSSHPPAGHTSPSTVWRYCAVL